MDVSSRLSLNRLSSSGWTRAGHGFLFFAFETAREVPSAGDPKRSENRAFSQAPPAVVDGFAMPKPHRRVNLAKQR